MLHSALTVKISSKCPGCSIAQALKEVTINAVRDEPHSKSLFKKL
jgi:hypothetical protein